MTTPFSGLLTASYWLKLADIVWVQAIAAVATAVSGMSSRNMRPTMVVAKMAASLPRVGPKATAVGSSHAWTLTVLSRARQLHGLHAMSGEAWHGVA